MFKTETQYALRALAVLAQHDANLSIVDLKTATGAPGPMLAKVLYRLGQRDLVVGRPGPGGGYRLSRPAGEITLSEVVAVTEGPDFGQFCLFGLENCSDEKPCPLHSAWGAVRTQLFALIEGHTLADLAGRRIELTREADQPERR